jgi:hypothetical protein
MYKEGIMNFGIFGILGLIGLVAGGVVTAQNVAEERRQMEQQTPAVEVQQIKGIEDESTTEIGQ